MENFTNFLNGIFDASMLDDSKGGCAGALLFIGLIIVCVIFAILKNILSNIYNGKIQPLIQPKINDWKISRREQKENLILAKAEKINNRRAKKAANNQWNAIAASCMK